MQFQRILIAQLLLISLPTHEIDAGALFQNNPLREYVWAS